MKSSLFAIAAYSAAADSGEELQCFGNRAHKVTYDIQGGDSLEDITDADILVERETSADDQCGGVLPSPSGDKLICIGANVDDACDGPAGVLPINNHFECENCFGGATTDLYYHYKLKGLSLEKVEVGLQNTKVFGALNVNAHGDAATDVKNGTITVPDKSISLSFKVKGVPVDIKISIPTTLGYDLGLEGHLKALAGADLDIDFGEHFLSWDKTDGFSAHNTEPTVNISPVLSVDTGDSGANIGMSLHSSLHVDVNSVIWYHVNLDPTFPSKIDYADDQFCLNGGMDFPISHEGALHHTLLGHDIIAKHYGPFELAHLHEDQLIHKCVGHGPSPPPAGTTIQSTATGLCVDVPGGDTTNGQILWMWECYGGDTQTWSFQDGQLKYLPEPNKCVDLLGNDQTNGNQLGLWDCYGGDSQLWEFDSDSATIYLASSGSDATKCINGGDSVQGSPIVIWDCDGEDHNLWKLGASLAHFVV